MSMLVYNKLMSDMRRHLYIHVRTSMQANVWNSDGQRLNVIRVFPFSGQIGESAALTHIEVTATPSYAEVSDLRHAEL